MSQTFPVLAFAAADDTPANAEAPGKGANAMSAAHNTKKTARVEFIFLEV
jgi:hypothetical protein